MTRPIEYFLSHQHDARDAVIKLETAMRRRGLASWRDRKNLAPGDETGAIVERAIRDETSGFVLYGSRHLEHSSFVWKNEWQLAVERRRREVAAGCPAPYRLSPLFVDGVSASNLGSFAQEHGQSSADIANGEYVASDDRADGERVARALLSSALADRATQHQRPIRIHLTTFAARADVDADVLVDWRPEVEGGFDASELVTARDDLRDALASLGRPIEVDAQARLPVAFMFGQAFPLASRIDVTAIHRDGERWRMIRDADVSSVSLFDDSIPGGDPSVAAVEVSLARSVATAADLVLAQSDMSIGRRVQIGFAAGTSAVDRTVAGAAAAVFGQSLRRLRDDGFSHVHVFMAVPAALAVLLGASISAGPILSLWTSTGARVVTAAAQA